MGFNTFRKHIKREPDRWYYHCDRLGMLVWQDMINSSFDLTETANRHFETESKEHVLANGVKVLLKHTDFKNDEVLFNAFSSGGTSLYNEADFAFAAHASSIVGMSGVGDLTATQLRNMLPEKLCMLNLTLPNV